MGAQSPFTKLIRRGRVILTWTDYQPYGEAAEEVVAVCSTQDAARWVFGPLARFHGDAVDVEEHDVDVDPAGLLAGPVRLVRPEATTTDIVLAELNHAELQQAIAAVLAAQPDAEWNVAIADEFDRAAAVLDLLVTRGLIPPPDGYTRDEVAEEVPEPLRRPAASTPGVAGVAELLGRLDGPTTGFEQLPPQILRRVIRDRFAGLFAGLGVEDPDGSRLNSAVELAATGIPGQIAGTTYRPGGQGLEPQPLLVPYLDVAGALGRALDHDSPEFHQVVAELTAAVPSMAWHNAMTDSPAVRTASSSAALRAALDAAPRLARFTVAEAVHIAGRGPCAIRPPAEAVAARDAAELFEPGDKVRCDDGNDELTAVITGIERGLTPDPSQAAFLLSGITVDDLKPGQVWILHGDVKVRDGIDEPWRNA